MLRQPSSTLTAIAALLVALVAGAGSQPSRSAANVCLSAPNGAAPNGQHWYYHLDRTRRRKCWYLRELTATPGADAVVAPAEADRTSPSAPADTAAKPADSVAAVHPMARAAASPPADTAAPPIGAAVVQSNISPTNESAAAFDASAPGDTKKDPLPAATDPSPSRAAATVWADPPPPASVGDLGPDAPASNGPPAAVSNVTATHATSMTTKDEAVAQRDAAPVTAAAPDGPPAKAVVPNLLVIALAAALAVAVSTIFKLVRRRKPVTGEAADFVAHFGSKPDRRSVVRSRLPTAEAVSSQPVPIQSTLIPEQLTMMRPSAGSRWQARLKR
jgi:hypothetical protein